MGDLVCLAQLAGHYIIYVGGWNSNSSLSSHLSTLTAKFLIIRVLHKKTWCHDLQYNDHFIGMNSIFLIVPFQLYNVYIFIKFSQFILVNTSICLEHSKSTEWKDRKTLWTKHPTYTKILPLINPNKVFNENI
jgi:hypothetical protein